MWLPQLPISLRDARPDSWTKAPLGPTPSLASPYAFVRNLTTGQNLYAKAPDTVCTPNQYASSMKIASMVVALREIAANSYDWTTTTTTVVAGDVVGGSGANLLTGDVVTLKDLIYDAMLESSNVAVQALARFLGAAMATRTGAGSTGITRFVEAVNAFYVEQGAKRTNCGTPYGTDSVSANTTTARDLARVSAYAFNDAAVQALSSPSLQEIARTLSYSMTVTRSGSPTVIAAVNGSTLALSGFDTGILATKGGNQAGTSDGPLTKSVLWQTPSGDNLLIVAAVTTKTGNSDLDVRGLYYSALIDFPSLLTGTDTDAAFSSVKALLGADSGTAVDESSFARAVTNNSTTLTSVNKIIGARSFSFDGSTSSLTMADSSDFEPGSGDFEVRVWLRGTGTVPASSGIVTKHDPGITQRSWSLQWDTTNSQFQFVLSTDGTNFVTPFFIFTDTSYATGTYCDASVFWNGCPRHLLIRRSSGVAAVHMNGVKATDVTYNVSLFNSSAKVVIGARQNNASINLFFTGILDEIEIRVGTGSVSQTGAKFSPVPRLYARS